MPKGERGEVGQDAHGELLDLGFAINYTTLKLT